MSVRILEGDCRDVLEIMQPTSVDAVVTDPPYALTANKRGGAGPASLNTKSPAGRARISTGFMGKAWDTGETAFDPTFWADVLRVLKPGGHVLAFGGTRTYHRLACAIEDAGFEIRDQIGWLYGSGFPKSHNQHDEWEGWGTALKPAWEPIVVARKPLDGTVAQNLARWGVGALNIDGCRVPADGRPLRVGDYKKTADNVYDGRQDGSLMGGSKAEGETDLGRWPANVIHDGSDEVLDAFPDAKGQIADASTSSSSRKTQNVYGVMRRGNGREGEPSAADPNDGVVGFKMRPGARRADSGSAARFFYCAKASRSDRNDGLEGFAAKPLHWSSGDKNPGSFQSEGTDKTARNPHPTVKPTELMRYLCRLVTPPGGTVLDPFMGSGSTGRGAVLEGFSFVGIEMEAEYVDIARARIAAVQAQDIFA